MTKRELEREIDASAAACSKCKKRKCRCFEWHAGRGVLLAPTGKAFGAAMKLAYRGVWDALEPPK